MRADLQLLLGGRHELGVIELAHLGGQRLGLGEQGPRFGIAGIGSMQHRRVVGQHGIGLADVFGVGLADVFDCHSLAFFDYGTRRTAPLSAEVASAA
ncbi:hypothetical protein KHQ06_34285 [Nocardia tengchongensis]|uniref:Uncharacterized protein n=1 Tax=Nocardia tengchongensis TaxID=2055889 RepID=A0ABX8CNA4_9NOCA|nr:hypothetical protein [Nocardia tengchongensis]QVI21059.1 hypothetical protein KHQ06_34285 [Nocardia tengchongensis]